MVWVAPAASCPVLVNVKQDDGISVGIDDVNVAVYVGVP